MCKRWFLICAPRGAFARLVETAGDATSALHAAALGELKRLSEAPATHEGVVASNRATLDADDHCLSFLLARLDEPEDDGWRREIITALLALATSSSACAEQWHRVGGVAALQALARETAEEGVERQAERCDEALVSLGVRRVRRRAAA